MRFDQMLSTSDVTSWYFELVWELQLDQNYSLLNPTHELNIGVIVSIWESHGLKQIS